MNLEEYKNEISKPEEHVGVPEKYFDKLPGRIMESVQRNNTKSFPNFFTVKKLSLSGLAVLLIVALVGTYLIEENEEKLSTSEIISEVTNAELEAYLDENMMVESLYPNEIVLEEDIDILSVEHYDEELLIQMEDLNQEELEITDEELKLLENEI